MSSRLAPALAAIGAALSLSACAPAGPHALTAVPRVVVASAAPSVATPSPDPGTPEPIPAAEALTDDTTLLTDIWLGPDPRGSAAQIALRFLRAVQRGDGVAADRELYISNRFELTGGDATFLRRVMADVRRHAGLVASGPCTTASELGSQTAVVTCGQRRVVVHVELDSYGHGVLLSDLWAHRDVFRGPHTHAFTTVTF